MYVSIAKRIEQIIAMQQQIHLLSIRQKENMSVDGNTLDTIVFVPLRFLNNFRYLSNRLKLTVK